MHDQSSLDPAASDDQVQMAVLTHLLLAYPAPFTLDEVVTMLQVPFDPSFETADGIRRAVRDLVCAGLLYVLDGAVLPTRSTARFWALSGL